MGGFKRRATDDAERRRPRPVRLGDLARENLDVFCWCHRCQHHATLASAELLARFGPALPVPEIGARLRCSGCGSRDVATRPAWPSPGRVSRHG
jgi:hypothetical protein